MQIKIITLLIVLGLTQLTACGQKGGLYLPEDPETTAAALVLIEVDGQPAAKENTKSE